MDHFSQYEGLDSMLESPEYEPVPVWGRIPKHHGGDAFFAQTLGTESTIPHCFMLKRRDRVPLSERPEAPHAAAERTHTTRLPARASSPPDTITFLTLSQPGVCSHPSTAHGGLVSVILDEVMSHTLLSHFPTEPDTVDETRMTLFTAQLEVLFKRPVRVPGVLIVKAWCMANSGKKYWMRAEAYQQEVRNGGAQELEDVVKVGGIRAVDKDGTENMTYSIT